MKFHYYPETDSLYIELSDQPGIESHEIKPGVVLDFSEEGHLVGLDLDHASRFINISFNPALLGSIMPFWIQKVI